MSDYCGAPVMLMDNYHCDNCGETFHLEKCQKEHDCPALHAIEKND